MTYTYWRRLCTLHLVSSNNQKESNVNKVLLKRTINNNSQTFTRNKDRKTQRGYLRHRNLNCTSVSHSRQLCNTTPHFTYREYYLRIHFNTTRHFTYAAYYLRIHLSCNDLHIVAQTLDASRPVMTYTKRYTLCTPRFTPCNDLHIVAYTLHASSGVVKQPKRIQCQQSEGVQHLQISK